MIELLSPAGDMESVKAAILFGADAVYVGGDEFGLRVNAGFSREELAQAVEYVHNHGKRIYLTCNIVADNSDIDRFIEFIKDIPSVDAVIVSDLGVFDLVRAHAPALPVHISTQAGVMNYATANMLSKLGAKRVILARETSVDDIKRIRDNTPPELELEAFVHGAMCVSFSGRCLISNYLTNRDANRGACSQPCRWNYHLVEETRPNEFLPIFEDEKGSYIFNSKDLCMIENIRELAECGVTTFKIEGRAKTAYYSAIVTNAYRAAIDAYSSGVQCPEWAVKEVECVSHRPYCTGFYLGEYNHLQSYEDSGYIRSCDFVGVVNGFEQGTLEITQRNYFTVDDCLEVVSPGRPPELLIIEEMRNSKEEVITIANHAVEKLWIKCGKGFVAGSLVRRRNS
jgi:putative protease